MAMSTGKKPEEEIEERVKQGIVQNEDIFKYLEMVINKSGNLKDHIRELNGNCKVINRAISVIGKKNTR